MSVKYTNKIETFDKSRYSMEDYGLFIVVSSIFCIIILQVFFRFVLRHSLPWTEELTRYLLVWLTFLGFSYHVKNDSHSRIAAFIGLFPQIIQKVCEIIVNSIFLFTSLIMTWLGIKLVILQLSTNRMPTSMPIPMFLFSIVIPLGFLFSSFYLSSRVWNGIRNIKRN